MSSWILTPKNPDPFTGFENKLLGWHITEASGIDVMEGANIVSRWGWLAKPYPTNMSVFPPIWEVEVSRPATPDTPSVSSIIIADTEWMVLDGQSVRALTEDDVAANYDVTQWPGPPAPPSN